MSQAEVKKKLQFAPEQKSPTLDIGNGDYSRHFDAKDQPFEAGEEEARMLLNTGHFVEATATAVSTSSSTSSNRQVSGGDSSTTANASGQ
jgi:hypothetical protein